MSLLASCAEQEPQAPSDLIARDVFVQVMADVQLIESRINHEMVVDQRIDSPARRYYDDLYTERKITKVQYERTYKWYTEHPEQMKAVYEDVLAELARRKEKGE